MSVPRSTWAAAAVLAAVAAAYLYTALLPSGPSTPDSVEPSVLVYVAVLALAAFAVKQALDSRSKTGGQGMQGKASSRGVDGQEPQDGRRSSGPGELVDELSPRFGVTDGRTFGAETDSGFRIVGSEFDELLQAGVDYEAEADTRNQARQQVVDELRETATYSVSRRMEVGLEEAEDMVLAGEWTEAPRAAALLSDGTGPDLPWRYRLLDLLAGRDVFLSSVEESVETITSGEVPR